MLAVVDDLEDAVNLCRMGANIQCSSAPVVALPADLMLHKAGLIAGTRRQIHAAKMSISGMVCRTLAIAPTSNDTWITQDVPDWASKEDVKSLVRIGTTPTCACQVSHPTKHHALRTLACAL